VPIRLRLAAAFALGTALVVVVASAVFVRFLSAGLYSSIDSGLRTRADAIVSTLGSVSAGDSTASPVATLGGQGEAPAQVFDGSGRLVAASPGTGNVLLLSQADLARARHGIITKTIVLGGGAGDSPGGSGGPAHAGERTRIRAYPVARAGGPWVVAVGSSIDATEAAIRRVINGALLGGPPAVLIAAVGAWLLAAEALRPVERMRRQVAVISESDRGTAIEVPPTRDEIASLARTMNDLLTRLQQALERERGFVADAGHELRTPLAILRTELELASRPGRSQAELAAAVAAAAEETDRLARLAEDLLLLARTEGSDPLRRQPTDLRALLGLALEWARPAAGSRGVELILEAPHMLECDVDPDRLRQAVDNLIDNAVRHAPPGTIVRAGAYGNGDGAEVVIDVSDEGAGFPPLFLPHAFERFRRADAARTRSDGGTGLGLAIVQSIARAHGGRAVASNRDGGGASVRLELPMGPRAPQG
jgi:two-component system OmpR family sensor kinase